MKLDFLQFLELEVFTRFGAKLEASIQKKIARGKILREILKQDRLSPVSVEGQMAWLVAFNEGYFDEMEPLKAKEEMELLVRRAADLKISLSAPRERWKELLENRK